MQNDYLEELGHLGLIARLKRVSDTMLYSIRDMYKIKGIDIEPNWHLVFLILKKNETLTMTEIADAFKFSQPAIVKIINKMKVKGYIDIVSDKHDNRKKQLKLSSKAIAELPFFEEVWNSGRASIEQLLEGDEAFLERLEKIEQELDKRSFKDRVLTHLDNH